MVVGASGGPKIITATLQTALNHMLAGFDLFEATTAPRIHDQILYHNEPTCVYSEETLLNGAEIILDKITMESMTKRGEMRKFVVYAASSPLLAHNPPPSRLSSQATAC